MHTGAAWDSTSFHVFTPFVGKRESHAHTRYVGILQWPMMVITELCRLVAGRQSTGGHRCCQSRWKKCLGAQGGHKADRFSTDFTRFIVLYTCWPRMKCFSRFSQSQVSRFLLLVLVNCSDSFPMFPFSFASRKVKFWIAWGRILGCPRCTARGGTWRYSIGKGFVCTICQYSYSDLIWFDDI